MENDNKRMRPFQQGTRIAANQIIPISIDGAYAFVVENQSTTKKLYVEMDKSKTLIAPIPAGASRTYGGINGATYEGQIYLHMEDGAVGSALIIKTMPS